MNHQHSRIRVTKVLRFKPLVWLKYQQRAIVTGDPLRQDTIGYKIKIVFGGILSENSQDT